MRKQAASWFDGDKKAGKGRPKTQEAYAKSVTNGGYTRRMTSSTQGMTSYKRKKEKTYSVHTILIYIQLRIMESNKKKEHPWGVPTLKKQVEQQTAVGGRVER